MDRDAECGEVRGKGAPEIVEGPIGSAGELVELALLFDQPLNEEPGFPLAGKSKPDFVPSSLKMEADNCPRGNVWSRPFLVDTAGSVTASSFIHEA